MEDWEIPTVVDLRLLVPLRRAVGLTQDDLTKRLGSPGESISNIERSIKNGWPLPQKASDARFVTQWLGEIMRAAAEAKGGLRTRVRNRGPLSLLGDDDG